MTTDETTAILASPPFGELDRQRKRIATLLTLLTLAAYFAFIFLMAFGRDILAQRIGSSSVNWGIPLGIGVILWSWLLTGIYVRWANSSYDTLVEEVKKAHHSQDSALENEVRA